ncbi:hypothetical protein QBC38DRAFT_405850 [Podospora fimiseda]|uniref:IVY1-phospholipid-binding protein n=1 Tax=Podospora fimiseda TaxID=252190 RepID=A0AAN7H2H7_9PEZI|nr:hypothetical protein QBC38DRAFT_405850 [Podospora fimiseda]
MASTSPPERGDRRPPSPSPSQLPPVPASPTYSYASTARPSLSQFNLPLPPPPRSTHAVLTKTDLLNSQTAYSDLLTTAKSYRLALASLSTAASAFGSALEACARLKEARAEPLGPVILSSVSGGGGPPGGLSNSFLHQHVAAAHTCTADSLLTVAGLQHLVANHQHILSETVYRAFEVPLLHELDKWRTVMEDEEEGYGQAVAAQSKEIRRLEKEGTKLQKQKRRDLNKFRNHLVELTTKLDGLTALHGEHSRTLLRESQETSVRIVEASCSLVRAEVDIFESLARKGWTGGGLEDVLERGVDLFANEADVGGGLGGGKDMSVGGIGSVGGGAPGGGGGSGEGSKLFSILPPKSILADTGGDSTLRPGSGNNRADSLLMDTDRYQSLAGLAAGVVGSDNNNKERDRGDTESVFSEFNRSRGVRPFSPQPQPIRMNPENLIVGSLEDNNSSDTLASSSGKVQQQKKREGMDDEDHEGEDHEGEDGDDEDEDSHPWRNEGLVIRARASVGTSLGDPQQRDDSWSVTSVVDGNSYKDGET